MQNKFISGFVSIIGSPNVGKSTLLNRIVGQKVSIVSERAQTTRNRVMGVYTKKDCQVVFLDTPGVTVPKNKLGEYMLKIAYESLNEVEAILFMTDAHNGLREKDEALLDKLRNAKAPIIAVINKTDGATLDQVETIRERLEKEENIEHIIKISAKEGTNVEKLLDIIRTYLEEGPQYFPDDMVTDQPERVICSELIREKALMLLREEVPHGMGVGIDKMSLREEGDLYDVWATIYCERDSHKGIIIGKKGSMLKRIGSEARCDMEWLLGTRVNLQLYVKVKSDWRNSVSVMRELGYE
ncbi:MAG: GTPase Era [Clostridia bacterium]|nr:GTPase Era [Clostridia bacterium]